MVFLTANRFVDMTRKWRYIRYFRRWYFVHLICCLLFVYSTFISIISDPLLFNSTFKAYLFDPINGIENTSYTGRIEFMNNLITISLLFFFNFRIFHALHHDYDNNWRAATKIRKQVFFQTVTLSIFYSIPILGCFLTAHRKETEIVKFYLWCLEICFQFCAGLPSLTFLFFCSYLRHDLMKFLRFKRYRIVPPKSTARVTSIQTTEL
ncbi:unnamed protein product [Caenorhabditis angaria]|uniref:Serpentine receptor class gamma n=1 Tax=Caenorhabditis angaria TaxID=860376 RepID=A0A9P1IKD5_9PELO|nr:unnamed protein product [Caenorhabditis angaria]